MDYCVILRGEIYEYTCRENENGSKDDELCYMIN